MNNLFDLAFPFGGDYFFWEEYAETAGK